ncbi:M67 family metallopeptidase [Thermococcus sp. AM4]|uniref:M67 family metallopeptidase n=1 Tax=Thermococcus sp. (strain AM4) TaxID=246969 RepID=UPI001ED92234|nr:M67 family metallopeptidase [Thermococcus sp. AM4]
MEMKLVLGEGLRKKLIEKARGSPVEVCGFLFGKKTDEMLQVVEVRFVPNRLNSPRAFEMEPEAMLEALEWGEERKLDVVGIFHSHLGCPAVPSERDLRGMLLWPVVWLIFSDVEGLRAWVLENEQTREVEIEVGGGEERQAMSSTS